MRVGFAGTPAFAATVLGALLDAGFAVPVVLTQPDRPKGRGLKAEATPVKRLALERGLRVLEPKTLKDPNAVASLLAIPVDVLAVAAYGLILPAAVLTWPRYGAINVHASLLPRWRGAAPIQRAILAGDAQTGVTIMQMDAGLDTGPMLESVSLGLTPRDTTASMTARLASEGAEALLRVLRDLKAGRARTPVPQPDAGVTYATKIDKAEAAIDWTGSAVAIDRKVRALDPAPGAMTVLGGEVVKIWRAELERSTAAGVSADAPTVAPGTPPGTIVEASPRGLVVACGEGKLRITELQPAGSRRMDAAAFSAGRRNLAGARFGAFVP